MKDWSTQVPALLVSIAAGLMVTKAASENSLGREMAFQIFTQPKAIGITAGICGLLALVPGIPKTPVHPGRAGRRIHRSYAQAAADGTRVPRRSSRRRSRRRR